MAETTITREIYWGSWPFTAPMPLYVWAEFTHVDSGGTAHTYSWAPDAISYPTASYGGPKEGRIISLPDAHRGISDRNFSMTTGSWSITLADTDGLFRAWLANANQKSVKNREMRLYAIQDIRRLAFSDTPRLIARGKVTRFAMLPNKQWQFTCEDIASVWLDNPNTLSLVSDDDGWTANIGVPLPICYGTWNFASGYFPGLYLGTMVMPGPKTVHAFCFGGHAVKSIDDVFVNGVSASGQFGISVYAPTQTGWLYGTNYVPLTHGWYTIVGFDVTIPPWTTDFPGATVTAAMTGIESVGDGTGTLISNNGAIYQHYMEQWAAVNGAYRSGAWPTPQAFADATPWVNGSAFAAIDSGWGSTLGAWGLFYTAESQRITVRDQVAHFSLGTASYPAINRKGQFSPILLPNTLTSATVVDRISETMDILDGSFKTEEYPSGVDLVNRVDYSYAPDMVTGVPVLIPTVTFVQDTTSIVNEQQFAFRQIDFTTLRNLSYANVAATTFVGQWVHGRIISLEVPLIGLNYEIGDVLSITTTEGPGTGYASQLAFIREITIDFDGAKVTLLLEDLYATG